MSGFPAQWLDLREPLDAQSRAVEIVPVLGSRRSPLAVVDLGAGTGANLRYAAPRMAGPQHWLLVERDPLLLAALQERMPDNSFCGPEFDCRVETRALDLATQLDRLPLQTGSLVTASALLDLVSESWLQDLVQRAAAAVSVVWFALSYDGRIECHPAEAEDEEVRELFNRHQLRDKGFGPALGPAAARTAARLLEQYGYQVDAAPSDWRIGPDRPALQSALLEGLFHAACEIAPERAAVLRGWLARRQSHVGAARSKLQVGHLDLVGLPHT